MLLLLSAVSWLSEAIEGQRTSLVWVSQDEVNLKVTKDKECLWKSYPILTLSRLGEYIIIAGS